MSSLLRAVSALLASGTLQIRTVRIADTATDLINACFLPKHLQKGRSQPGILCLCATELLLYFHRTNA